MAKAIARKKISLLPEHLIDQIKAGEVVERPASIIKELVENSVDAQSSRIEIHIVEGGLTLIRIKDNGIGMSASDIPMAFCRHATSKITTFEDLYHLISYGFRGEALASVAAVSRVECESIPQEDFSAGGKIEFEAGVEISHFPMKGNESGTSITVRDLFFNTPARLKFVKSLGSEKNALERMIDSFILSNPEITFSVQWDQEDRLLYKGVSADQLRQRVWEVIGKRNNRIDDLIYFEKEHLGHKISGFVSLYTVKSAPSKSQFMFANKRIFTDKSLHHAVTTAMDGIWQREQGSYVLFIDAPPEEIDVNVHPNKTHIKFSNSSMIYSLVIAAIKESLPQVEREEKVDSGLSAGHRNSNYSASSFSSPLNLPNIYQTEGHSNQRQVYDLGKQIFIVNDDENRLYFMNRGNVLRKIIDQTFARDSILDDEIIPLLVAHKFQAKLNEHIIKKASQLGFQIDSLSSDEFILKSIPEDFSFFKSKQRITNILTAKLKGDAVSDTDLLLDNDETLSLFDTTIELLSGSKFYVPLTQELYEGLLNG